jgi:hypothetical protein
MKLEKVGHLYEPQETENYLLRQRNGNGVIIDKRTSEKITYENNRVIALYENSISNLNIKGDILIVGLGIGLLPHNFKKLSEVNSISVLEKNIDVINFVKPIMPWIEFIHTDAFEYDSGRKWDTIFLDIYHNLTPEYKVDQLVLIEKYSKMVKDNNISYLKIHNIIL